MNMSQSLMSLICILMRRLCWTDWSRASVWWWV